MQFKPTVVSTISGQGSDAIYRDVGRARLWQYTYAVPRASHIYRSPVGLPPHYLLTAVTIGVDTTNARISSKSVVPLLPLENIGACHVKPDTPLSPPTMLAARLYYQCRFQSLPHCHYHPLPTPRRWPSCHLHFLFHRHAVSCDRRPNQLVDSYLVLEASDPRRISSHRPARI